MSEAIKTILSNRRAHSLTAIVLLLIFCAGAKCESRREKTLGDLIVRHPVPVQWQNLEAGLDFSKFEFTRKSDNRDIALAALRIDPAKFSFGLLGRDKPDDINQYRVHLMREKGKAVAAVNGSFFMSGTFDPIGLLVVDGDTANLWKPGAGSGLFRSRKGWATIEWAKAWNPDWLGDEFAIQSKPLIVEPGGKPGIYADSQKYRARTALGIDKKGKVIVLCSYRELGGEQLSGLDLYELMQIMLVPQKDGGLGLPVALNLDGGVSTGMSIDLPNLKLEIPSIHPVRNAVGVFRRK